MQKDQIQRKSRLGCVLTPIVLLGLLLLAAVSLVAWYQWRYTDKVYPGVSVAGMPLGDLTSTEAAGAIADALNPYPGPEITLRFEDRTWVLRAEEVGVSVDAGATAAAAFAVGRAGLSSTMNGSIMDLFAGLRDDLLVQWEAMRDGIELQPILQYNEDLLDNTVRSVAAEVNLASVEGRLSISGLEVSGMPGQVGRTVDVEATRQTLSTLARRGLGGFVELVVEEKHPAILSVEPAVAKAKAVLGRSFILTADAADGVQRFSADAAQVRQWLTLTPAPGADGVVDLDVSLDRERVVAFVADIAAQLERKAYDASLDWDVAAGKVVVLEPSQKGQAVDVEEGVAAVEAALAAPPAIGPDGAIATQQITLTVTTILPKVDSERIADLGIVELISEGTTSFKGSPAERVHNIVTAADKFQHVVVPPDEEFSFNKNVGSVSAANGFTDALVIAGDRTAVGIGGGVCQVSTTAFRAAFWGGFPIVERWAHGYVVSWYGEPGMDASIFTPNVDFRFRNDTGHFILVKSAVNKAQGKMTFYIYGTKPDRKVEMTGPVISNRQPAPGPLYQEDATLKTGQIKQIDWAKEGLDAVVTRIIRFGDGTAKEEKIVSKYRPWRSVYLYGPGTDIPEQTP